jgi:L-threonylcarbamoyladenylate synthase
VSAEVERATDVLRSGGLAIVPTDTVYGLAAAASRPDAVRSLYEAKGRDVAQPTALVAAGIGLLLECVPELGASAYRAVRRLLPGPYTLVVPNPAGHFAWLCGDRPTAIGVRVPAVAGTARALLERAGPIAATSANMRGGPDPRSLAGVPAELLALAAATVDAGELLGVPSTVVDVTGDRPRVLREGAVAARDVLDRLG